MSYVVSARKYRPQIFEEVVGQEHITSTIKNAILHDKLAHAFLFCGPRGVGKTTCARLLAKVINMDDPKAAVVDGSYADQNIDISLNIIELDAASNNSVENIRTLIEQVRFQPQQGKYKVFIIDEVHMLSQAAFNAFLKTLEEPPPYAIFILATTERHKILPTILSRCQLYDFRRIQVPEIISQLEVIAQKENIEVEHDALYVIAEKADGAMRDALSIFDRIASASANVISLQSVIDNLNILDFDYFFEATDKVMLVDPSGLLLLLDRVFKNGFEGDTFMNGFAQHMRNLLYCKQEPTQKMMQMSSDMKAQYLSQAQSIDYRTLMTCLSLANQCDLDYPKAKDKRLHVEVAMLKMCYAGTRDVSQPISFHSTSEKKTVEQAAVVPQPPKVNPPGEAFESKEQVEPSTEAKVVDVVTDEIVQDEPVPVTATLNTPSISSLEDVLKKAEEQVAVNGVGPSDLNMDDIESIWSSYIEQHESSTTSAILKTVLKEIVEDKVIITVPSNIAKEEIQQETDLYSKLREHFNQGDLIIQIIVDRQSFPDIQESQTKKLYTPKEKYDHLKSVNPLVDDLISSLDLKLEQ